ncbi:hypothetical protein BN381_10233 [Candidatus Microthrix parvicella RN1]|uniref:Uncharacterized protein n=1 Tax=Candidatus Neomicrothrix parvicella RN1 TaxID=1229780 RepID=R4Z050_9ACTN|nr:hypothetical protein BN381_10233 [Candidatus Microthrix parvicella RN1]
MVPADVPVLPSCPATGTCWAPAIVGVLAEGEATATVAAGALTGTTTAVEGGVGRVGSDTGARSLPLGGLLLLGALLLLLGALLLLLGDEVTLKLTSLVSGSPSGSTPLATTRCSPAPRSVGTVDPA